MRPCPSCGAPLSSEARFCNHCGQTVAAAAPAPAAAGTMRVCPSCGVIAPLSRTECTACGAHYGNAPPTVEARFDKNYWACIIEADFACRGCGMRSPMDSLDVDGEVDCRRCGMTQTFDADQWDEALVFAQDVADCAGPPGRLGKPPVVGDNDFKSIGVDHTFAEKTLTGMVMDSEGMKPRSLRVKVAPGVPLCEKCRVPLDVQVDTTEYKTQTTCPRCHERAVYDTPEDVFDHNADIAAVLADDHRCDRQDAAVHASPGGGAVAIACPRCNASLPVTEGTSLINCGYCGTPSRIPRRVLGKLGGQAKPKRWWILFDDESQLRAGVTSDDDDDDDDSDDDDSGMHDDRMARVREAQAAEAATRARPVEKPANGPPMVGIALGIVAVLGVAGVGASIAFGRSAAPAAEPTEKSEKSEKGEMSEGKGKGKSKADEPAVAPLVRSKFQDLKGCACKAGSETRQLALRVDVEGMGMTVGEDDGMVANFDLSWLLDSDDKFFQLKNTEGAPPLHVKGRALAVGVACSGDVFAVVARNKVTGWSVEKKKPLWSEDLAEDYRAAAPPSQKGLNVQCSTVPLAGTTLKIPIGKGATKSLNILTGK